MVDVVDKVTRSRMMSGIRSKNTDPELYLRKGLHRSGFRFRLHVKGLPGKPDIALPKYRALINVHGCFWHSHGCRLTKIPSSNTAFWQDKLRSNKLRDERAVDFQLALDWRSLVVWECAIRKSQRMQGEIDVLKLTSTWLRSESRSAIIDESGLIDVSNRLT